MFQFFKSECPMNAASLFELLCIAHVWLLCDLDLVTVNLTINILVV